MLVVEVVGREEMTSTSIGWDGTPGGGGGTKERVEECAGWLWDLEIMVFREP